VCSRRLYSCGPGLDYSPTGDEAKVYKYYCPLCMGYFRGRSSHQDVRIIVALSTFGRSPDEKSFVGAILLRLVGLIT
jgi:hypothetical protein